MIDETIIVKTAFERRVDQTKEDIETGKITLRNAPKFWDEKMLDTAALKCTLFILANEARWN